MARTSVAKTAVEESIVDTAEINVNEENTKNTRKSIKTTPLEDSDEIEVVSLIPNVSYKDSKTGDMYEWDDVGHIEYMTFDILKNMWRNNKGYFRNMWLRPNDDRVINQFGLTKTFAKYEYLMDASNYTRKNIDAICKAISETPNGLKIAICDRVKSLVVGHEVADVSVIKALEKHLNIDLIEFLD